MSSPYDGLDVSQWEAKTIEIIKSHPFSTETIVELVRETWDSIFESTIGHHAKIGEHIFPSPQMMGIFIHELIPLAIASQFPGDWRRDETGDEKDLVCISDRQYSTEIKCSSSKNKIFANRSYAQRPTDPKKSKSGYYIAINFEKFGERQGLPRLRLIRFGWLDVTVHTPDVADKYSEQSIPKTQ
jgi:hypothetical protein